MQYVHMVLLIFVCIQNEWNDVHPQLMELLKNPISVAIFLGLFYGRVCKRRFESLRCAFSAYQRDLANFLWQL